LNLNNNISVQNGGYGLYMPPDKTLNTRGNNNIWSNGAGNYMNADPGEGDISADPLFADSVNGDLRNNSHPHRKNKEKIHFSRDKSNQK